MFKSKGPILLGLVPHGFRVTPETELSVELRLSRWVHKGSN